MNNVALIFVFGLAVWKIHDLFFPEKTTMGKRLVKKIIEVRLLKAFYKDFLYAIIDTDKDTQQVMVDAWLKTEYESWLEKKAETGELSDIIKTKE